MRLAAEPTLLSETERSCLDEFFRQFRRDAIALYDADRR
jgi:hypothetical protein